jgi:hypothetical protein
MKLGTELKVGEIGMTFVKIETNVSKPNSFSFQKLVPILEDYQPPLPSFFDSAYLPPEWKLARRNSE